MTTADVPGVSNRANNFDTYINKIALIVLLISLSTIGAPLRYLARADESDSGS